MNRTIYLAVTVAALLLLVSAVGATGGKKYSDNIARSLFSDRRAYQVGDVVTVLITEYSIGSNESGTATGSKSDLNLSAVGSGDLSSTNMGAQGAWEHNFDGTGGTQRKGSLQGTLSARITEITETGNLVIEGTRMITVNGEKQVSTLKGIVRPEDISGSNTVYSFNIADAQISYTGKGDVNAAGKPGFFTKIFNMIF
ncbi:MAG: flagellar basal body L-ring protein FlgH [bacterium]|nr:flagellar basal body L-ring protein FlgH [bacterium]